MHEILDDNSSVSMVEELDGTLFAQAKSSGVFVRVSMTMQDVKFEDDFSRPRKHLFRNLGFEALRKSSIYSRISGGSLVSSLAGFGISIYDIVLNDSNFLSKNPYILAICTSIGTISLSSHFIAKTYNDVAAKLFEHSSKLPN